MRHKWGMTSVLGIAAVLAVAVAPLHASEVIGTFDSAGPFQVTTLGPDLIRHETVTTIADITNPDAPRELWRGGNVLTVCGLMNLLLTARDGVGANIPSSGPPASPCGGPNNAGQNKKTAKYDAASSIVIGAANNADCEFATSPWPCCTGLDTGNCNVASSTDVVLYTEGQPYQDNLLVENYFAVWVNSGRPNFYKAVVDGPSPFQYPLVAAEHPPTALTMLFKATVGGASGNQKWCEYSVRSSAVNSGEGLSNSGGTWLSGWALNHGIINPCLTKTAGSIWSIEVLITITPA